MKTFNLGIYNIVVTIDENNIGGITSSLLSGEDCDNIDEYVVAINAIESIILAHACAGINIESKEYISGVQTTLDTIANFYS